MATNRGRTAVMQDFDFNAYINITKIKKEYRRDKILCWFTALKYNFPYIIVYLLLIIGFVLLLIEYPPKSYAVGYWLILMILCIMVFMGFIVIGRFIEAVQNYQSEIDAFDFDWYFYKHYNFKYCLNKSDISTGTFFIKKRAKFEWETTPGYVLCYRNNKDRCSANIKVISNDTIKTLQFNIFKMTLYIPNGYKMPVGSSTKDIIYVQS